MKTALERARALIAPWWMAGLVLVCACAVVAGVFDPAGQAWLGAILGVALASAIGYDARVRLGNRPSRRPFAALEGPLLWVVGVWALLRVAGPYGAHLTPLAAALLAWLVATFPIGIHGKALALAALLELGLTVAGRQDFPVFLLHVVLYGGAAWALSRMARGEAFRSRMLDERALLAQQADRHDRARELGLLTAQAPALGALPGYDDVVGKPTVGRMALDHLSQAFALELDGLRVALGLRLAVLLWHDVDNQLLAIRGTSGEVELLPGPFPDGAGLPGGVLKGGKEVAVAPLHAGMGGLPYLVSQDGVGAVLAVAIPHPGGDGPAAGVLCVDRDGAERWTEREREVVRLSAQSLALDVSIGQKLKAADTERNAVHRICVGLQALNGALGIEQVAAAAINAIQVLAHADLAVVSVVRGDVHHVLRAEGVGAKDLAGLHFTGDEGLVGQAVKHNRSLPVGGVYRGNRGVFTGADRLDGMRSLLILPLVRRDGTAIGALTVAAAAEGQFTANRREMLELIAGQVGVKLELAQMHERIRGMASTDGLTGLANHRVFQQAFDNMLTRARRQKSPVAMLLTDIDRFKRLNDTYGHPFGDVVLKGVSRVLAGAVRKVDLAARYGGEEFAVLLEGSDDEGGRRLAERIRAEVESLRFDHEKGPVQVTMSIGLAIFPEDADEKADVIDRADKALYYAKEHGRNRSVAWADIKSEAPAEPSAD